MADSPQRTVERAYALVALAGMILVVWERLNPDGPREAWARFRSKLAEYRAYRAAMQQTLDEIHDLPESSPLPESAEPGPAAS